MRRQRAGANADEVAGEVAPVRLVRGDVVSGSMRSLWRRWAAVVVVLMAAGLSLAGTASPAAAVGTPPPGSWASAGTAGNPVGVSEARSVRLLDGRVLSIHSSQVGSVTAWLYDPMTGWAPGGGAGVYGFVLDATLIKGPGCGIHCGRVLAHFSQHAWLLYDPPSGAWLPAPRRTTLADSPPARRS